MLMAENSFFVHSHSIRSYRCILTAQTSLPWKPGGQTMSACWKGSGRAAQSCGAPGCRGMLLWATAAMEAAEGW